MIRAAAFLVLCLALAVFAFDAIASIASGDTLYVSSFRELWQRIAPNSLAFTNATLETVPLALRYGATFLMALPAWFVLAAIGAMLALASEPFFGRRQNNSESW